MTARLGTCLGALLLLAYTARAQVPESEAAAAQQSAAQAPAAQADPQHAAAAAPQAGEGRRAPRLVDPAKAVYPAAGDGRTAEVELRVQIDAAGVIERVQVLSVLHPEPTLHPAFAQAAIAYARGARFLPALLEGTPVRAATLLRVRFEAPPRGPTPHADGSTDAFVVAPPKAAARSSLTPAPNLELPKGAAAPGLQFSATAKVKLGVDEPAPPAASAFAIELAGLRDVPRSDTEAFLTLAPGVVLTNHAGEGHASQVFMRGFDAGEGQDLELRVDGVPINEPSNAHAHGYADSHFVIPELVQTVTVLEGPFDARQGNFAVAGSAEYELGAPRPGVLLKAEYGSFAERRVVGVYAPAGHDGQTFAAVELRGGDGFGPNRSHDSATATGQVRIAVGSADVRVSGTSHALRFDSAGIVRADAVSQSELICPSPRDDPFFCTHDPNQDGSAGRHQLGLALRHRAPGRELGFQTYLALRDNRFRENFTGFLLDERGDGLDEQTEAMVLGTRGHYRWDARLAGAEQHFELGYEGRHDRGRAIQWRLRRDALIPYETVFAHELRLTNLGAYALSELELWERLTLRLGLRADSFGYEIVDLDRAESDLSGPRLSTQAVSAWGLNLQPRASVRVRIAGDLYWQSSIGSGSRASDASALSQGERAPFARAWAAETGLVEDLHTAELDLDARAIAFYTHVDQDLLFDPQRGRNVPIGASNRVGAQASLRLRWDGRLDTVHSVVWSEAHLPDDGESFALLEGTRMPFVPRFTARSDTAYRDGFVLADQRVRWTAALGIGWVGPRPLPLERFSEPIALVDLRLSLGLGPWLLGFSVLNLLDRRNRMAEFDHASHFDATRTLSLRSVRHFSAGAPRSFLLSLALELDTEDTEQTEGAEGEPRP